MAYVVLEQEMSGKVRSFGNILRGSIRKIPLTMSNFSSTHSCCDELENGDVERQDVDGDVDPFDFDVTLMSTSLLAKTSLLTTNDNVTFDEKSSQSPQILTTSF